MRQGPSLRATRVTAPCASGALTCRKPWQGSDGSQDGNENADQKRRIRIEPRRPSRFGRLNICRPCTDKPQSTQQAADLSNLGLLGIVDHPVLGVDRRSQLTPLFQGSDGVIAAQALEQLGR